MAHHRYRVEDGVPCIDVRVATIEQIFDNRDPAPFRDRDLDPTLAEYLLDAGEDLAAEARFRVVFWIEQPAETTAIEHAVRAHFRDAVRRIDRRRARQRRGGQVALLLAIALVIALVSLAQLVESVVPGKLGVGLGEGLVISSWVAMWRPVEILLYDWIPVRRDRRVASRLHDAAIDTRLRSPAT